MTTPDGEQDNLRGSSRRSFPQQAQLPAWGVFLVAVVGLIYGWSQNGNPPAPQAPPGAKSADIDRNSDHKTTPDAQTTEDGPRVSPDSEERTESSDANHSENGKSLERSAPRQISAPDPVTSNRRKSRSPQTQPQPPPSTADKSNDATTERPRATLIPRVTLKNQDGRVVYQGPIDLQPTIDRISKGERNQHRNDGTVFQNREGRLAQQPSGYYREYVVPTPNQGGPGPQRLIVGQGGEVFYTADHYRTFRKIAVEIDTPHRDAEN